MFSSLYLTALLKSLKHNFDSVLAVQLLGKFVSYVLLIKSEAYLSSVKLVCFQRLEDSLLNAHASTPYIFSSVPTSNTKDI